MNIPYYRRHFVSSLRSLGLVVHVVEVLAEQPASNNVAANPPNALVEGCASCSEGDPGVGHEVARYDVVSENVLVL